MFKILLLATLFFSPLMAAEAPTKPRIVIEAPAESEPELQYNVKDKITNMLFSLGIIVTAVFGVTYALKKITRKRLDVINEKSSIKLLEKRTLAPKTHLYVIEAHNKTLLIGESPDGLVMLSELSPGFEEANPTQVPLSFTQVLKKKFEDLKA